MADETIEITDLTVLRHIQNLCRLEVAAWVHAGNGSLATAWQNFQRDIIEPQIKRLTPHEEAPPAPPAAELARVLSLVPGMGPPPSETVATADQCGDSAPAGALAPTCVRRAGHEKAGVPHQNTAGQQWMSGGPDKPPPAPPAPPPPDREPPPIIDVEP